MKKYFAAAALLVMMAACGTQDQKLEGTTWKLTQMEAIPATAMNGEADFFTIQFNAADTLVAGRTNCNHFFGKYNLDNEKLTMPTLGMTRMACPDMEYEDAFAQMLSNVQGFKIAGEELTLLGDGQPLATFKAVAEEPATK